MPTLLEFGLKFLWQLINNICIGEREGGGEFLPDSIRRLRTPPRHAIRYQNWRWICTAKTAYQQYICSFKLKKNKKVLRMNPRSIDMQWL